MLKKRRSDNGKKEKGRDMKGEAKFIN